MEVVAEAGASRTEQQHHVFELWALDLKDATDQLLQEARIDVCGTVAASTNGDETLASTWASTTCYLSCHIIHKTIPHKLG